MAKTASDAPRWADLEAVADALGDMPVEELKLRLARLGVDLGLHEPPSFTPAATRVFEASGIADQPETSTPGSADSEQRRRGDLLRLLRRCDDIDRIIGDAEAGAEAAAAAAQLRSSAATIKRMLQEADAPRPRTATATARGRVGSPPRQAQPSSGGPSARRSQRPATRQGPARGTSDPWIPPGYDGLDAAAARERQATASERSIVRMLQEELKVARKEHSEEVGALRRENQALRRTVASLRSEIGVVKAREGARGAEKSALKAALEAKEHRARMAEVRSRETEEVTLRARQRFQEELESVRQERDELKAILLSTLKRLEVVEEIACKQDASHAVMVERLRALEQEKERALNDAAATKEDIKCTTAAMESLQREHEMLRTLARAGALSAGGKDRAVKEYFRDQQGIRHKLEQVLAASGAGGDISGVTSPRSEGTVDGDGAMPPLLRVKELAAELGLSADLTKRLLEKA